MGMAWLTRLWRTEDGSIAVLGALALVSTLGMSGLAVEIGNGYAAKIRNQRVADMAALGAAIAYKNSGQSGTTGSQIAQDVATAIATANGQTNGVNGASVTAALDNAASPTKITVTITTPVPIKLASVLTSAASFNVTNSAVASLASSGGGAGCITALGSSGNTVSADGGAKILASGCAINTNGTIYSNNTSATITAKQMVGYAISDAATSWGGAGVITNPTARNWTLGGRSAADPIKANTAVQNALCIVNKLSGASDTYDATANPYGYVGGNTNCTSPLVPPTTYAATGAADWTLGYQPKSAGGVHAYETGDYTCNYSIPAGTYTIGKLTVPGGCSITFLGSATLTFDSIDASGATVVFPNGSMTVTGNFNVNANSAITIGNGAHSFGSLTIGGGKKLDVGSGNFNLSGGLSVSGGAYLKVNTAAGNTVTIGTDGSGNSITVSGGSLVCFTSDCTMPTVAAGTFSASGNVSVTGGGSTMVFPKAATHVINGDLTLTAVGKFGAGMYYIKGNFQNTVGSGSDSMDGTEVTFVAGGTFNFAGGSRFDLAAPTSASTYGIPDVLFLTKTSAATQISAGATGKASGLIYAPNSAFSSSGGSAISSNGSACLMLVVSSISVTGSGTVTTNNCTSLASSGGGGGTVALIQ